MQKRWNGQISSWGSTWWPGKQTCSVSVIPTVAGQLSFVAARWEPMCNRATLAVCDMLHSYTCDGPESPCKLATLCGLACDSHRATLISCDIIWSCWRTVSSFNVTLFSHARWPPTCNHRGATLAVSDITWPYMWRYLNMHVTATGVTL